MAIQFTDQSSNLKMVSNVLHLSCTATAGSSVTASDTRITASMRVINCVFGTPHNVASNITWITNAGSIEFAGTFIGSTTIDFDLVEAFT